MFLKGADPLWQAAVPYDSRYIPGRNVRVKSGYRVEIGPGAVPCDTEHARDREREHTEPVECSGVGGRLFKITRCFVSIFQNFCVSNVRFLMDRDPGARLSKDDNLRSTDLLAVDYCTNKAPHPRS